MLNITPSATKKFAETSAPSAIMLKKKTPQTNKIVTIDLKDSQKLLDGVLNYCEFSVCDSGYYHINTQLCVKNYSKKIVNVDYLQHGLACLQFDDYEQNFNSIVLSSLAEPEYVISNNLSTIIHLQEDKPYICWLNFCSDDNTKFEYIKDFSHLRLYKL